MSSSLQIHQVLSGGFAEITLEPDDEAEGARAYEIFCTPALSSYRAPDHEKLVERARFHLRSARHQRVMTSVADIQTYTFEPDGEALASLLVVHGWTGEAAFMCAIADFLRRRRFRVVLMDLPAHGRSGGTETTLMNCAHAAREVAAALGPIRFVLGHSIGGMAALLVGEGRPPIREPYPFDAYVLLSTPDRFGDVTRRFGDELGLTPGALRVFEQRLEQLARRSIQNFSGSKLVTSTAKPTLLIHSRDDADVPFPDAVQLAAASPLAELKAVDGLGHRNILYAPPVVRAAADFLLQRV